MGRDRPVDGRWVPPQPWRSRPTISTMRIVPSAPGGGATDRLRSRPDSRVAFVRGQIGVAHGQVLPDRVVHGGLEGAEAVIVGVGQVEVHADGAVVIELRARHQRTSELLVDEGVQDMGVGVELAHQIPEARIDRCLHHAR